MTTITRNTLVLEYLHALMTYGADSQAADMWRTAIELWDENHT